MNDNKKESIIIAVVVIALIIGIVAIVGTNIQNKGNKPDTNVAVSTTAQSTTESTTESTKTSTTKPTTETTTKRKGGNSERPTSKSTIGQNKNNGNKKPSKKPETTTEKPTKPLTEAQKQWIIDNYFGKFPELGAEPDYKCEENPDLDKGSKMSFTQDNYKEQIAYYFSPESGDSRQTFAERKASRTFLVEYKFFEQDGKTILQYTTSKR